MRTFFSDAWSQSGTSNLPASFCSTLIASWRAWTAFTYAASLGSTNVRIARQMYRVPTFSFVSVCVPGA